MRYLVLDDAIEGNAFGLDTGYFCGRPPRSPGSNGRVSRQTTRRWIWLGQGRPSRWRAAESKCIQSESRKSGMRSGSDDEIPTTERLKVSLELCETLACAPKALFGSNHGMADIRLAMALSSRFHSVRHFLVRHRKARQERSRPVCFSPCSRESRATCGRTAKCGSSLPAKPMRGATRPGTSLPTAAKFESPPRQVTNPVAVPQKWGFLHATPGN